MVRFGLIGYGAWGSVHARTIAQVEGCELRAVAAPSEQSRARASEETGARVFADYRELLACPDIDAVSVVAPNHLHEPIARAALAAAKHVLLEKPMALTVEGCDRILAAAQTSGKVLLVGHELHYSPLYTGIHRLIQEGAIGGPRYVLIDLWRRPYRQGSEGWKQDPARVGSWSLEEPVHYFDVIAWFLQPCGEPRTVAAFGNRRDPNAPASFGIHDNFTAVLTYDDGAYGVISQSLSAVEHHLSVKVFGSAGVLRAEWHAEQDRSLRPTFSLWISEGVAMKPLPVETTPGEVFELAAQIGAFRAAIEDGRPLPFTPVEARRAVALCLEAEQALELGRPVEHVQPAPEQSRD